MIYLFLLYNLFATCSFSTMYSVIKDQDLEFYDQNPYFSLPLRIKILKMVEMTGIEPATP